jgi:hypothetical protein
MNSGTLSSLVPGTLPKTARPGIRFHVQCHVGYHGDCGIRFAKLPRHWHLVKLIVDWSGVAGAASIVIVNVVVVSAAMRHGVRLGRIYEAIGATQIADATTDFGYIWSSAFQFADD